MMICAEAGAEVGRAGACGSTDQACEARAASHATLAASQRATGRAAAKQGARRAAPGRAGAGPSLRTSFSTGLAALATSCRYLEPAKPSQPAK